MKKLLSLYLAVVLSLLSVSARTVRILAIGNSFSQDAIEQYLRRCRLSLYLTYSFRLDVAN